MDLDAIIVDSDEIERNTWTAPYDLPEMPPELIQPPSQVEYGIPLYSPMPSDFYEPPEPEEKPYSGPIVIDMV
jgi:hypothetical protein